MRVHRWGCQPHLCTRQVVVEPSCPWQVFGIEHPAPVLVGPSAGADNQAHSNSILTLTWEYVVTNVCSPIRDERHIQDNDRDGPG
jgi:hypothetical protein